MITIIISPSIIRSEFICSQNVQQEIVRVKYVDDENVVFFFLLQFEICTKQ